jgi:hypothetical protein
MKANVTDLASITLRMAATTRVSGQTVCRKAMALSEISLMRLRECGSKASLSADLHQFTTCTWTTIRIRLQVEYYLIIIPKCWPCLRVSTLRIPLFPFLRTLLPIPGISGKPRQRIYRCCIFVFSFLPVAERIKDVSAGDEERCLAHSAASTVYGGVDKCAD